MLNVHLSYKPPSSWRVLFRSEGRPRKFIILKMGISLVVPEWGLRKELILQGIMEPTGVLPNEQSCLIIKVDVMLASVHAQRQRNIPYSQVVVWSIQDTR